MGEHPRPPPARQIHVAVAAALAPKDVAGSGPVGVDQAHLLDPQGPLRRLHPSDNVWIGRPAHAVDVEPHVHRVEANLHEVIQAVAIDVVQANTAPVDAGVLGGAAHLDERVFCKSAGAASERPRSPRAIATSRPIPDIALLDVDDVLQAVAVHVGQVNGRVAEAHGNAGSDERHARRHELQRQFGRPRPRPRCRTKVAVASGIAAQRKEGLHLGAGRAHDVDEAITVGVEHVDVRRVFAQVEVRVLEGGCGDRSTRHEPIVSNPLWRVDRVRLHCRLVQPVDRSVAVDVAHGHVAVDQVDVRRSRAQGA